MPLTFEEKGKSSEAESEYPETQRISDEILTLRALEQYVDTKRRKRNQLIAITLA